MMISGHHQKLFEPFRIGTEIAMRPGSVKGDKNQIPQDDRLRKPKHERNKDKSAHQSFVHKVGASARDPVQRLRRMVYGMKSPEERHFMQSQVNEIFGYVRDHHGQEKLQQPRHASDKSLNNRNTQIFRGLRSGQ